MFVHDFTYSSFFFPFSIRYLDKPTLHGLDSWTIAVNWELPAKPNGEIRNYSLYQNDIILDTMPPNTTYFRVNNLKPFNWYSYFIEACTKNGCTRSQEAKIQTSATSPEVCNYFFM